MVLAVQQCTPEVLASPDVKLAMKLHQALQGARWLPYFRQLLAASYLPACLGNMYSAGLRCTALQALLKGQGADSAPGQPWGSPQHLYVTGPSHKQSQRP